MDQSGNKREIEIRSLTGESIVVTIEPNKTVQDLKLLLKHTFSPASSSPNFHLFLKGVKLKLQSQISSYMIGAGEILVVVPYVKKDRQQGHRVEASDTQSKDLNSKERLETELADSAWADLMQDLSSVQDVSNCEKLSETELKSMKSLNGNACDRRTSSRMTRRSTVLNKDKEGPSYDDLLSILQTSGENMFDEQNIKKFFEFIESSGCLSDPATGYCVMTKANAVLDSESDPCKSSLCQCPLWLKDIMKTFSFINVYSACLQLWQKEITISALKEPLDQLHKFGFHQGIADLGLLSQICPQTILIVDKEVEEAKSRDALVITKTSAGNNDQHEDQLPRAAKRLPKSKIVSSLKKREISLKAILSEAAKSSMLKSGEAIKSFLLEDLLIFVKKADTTAGEAGVKRERRKYSATSSSLSHEVQCHVSQFWKVLKWLCFWYGAEARVFNYLNFTALTNVSSLQEWQGFIETCCTSCLLVLLA